MFTITNCPCCDRVTQTIMPAYLSQFVVWRTTGVKPESNVKNLLIQCDTCNFYFSDIRFTDEEIARLYKDYRGNEYNQMRLECEPNYKVELYSDNYVKQRKEFINKLKVLKCNVDENPEIPSQYAVRGIPALMLFKDGKLLDSKVGSLPKTALIEWINKYI